MAFNPLDGQPSIFGPGSRTIVNGGNFTIHTNTKPLSTQDEERRAFKRLGKNSCTAAAFNSRERYDAPKCHPHTREATQTNICDWTEDLHIYGCLTSILWLYGPAGAGKSAIAQSMAETLAKNSKLAASFFFSRTAGGDRGHEGRLVSTIAYQFCQSFPPVRPYIEKSITNNPSIFDLVLSEQVKILLIQPLQQFTQESPSIDFSTAPRTIIIDGLDECKDGAAQRQVLDVLDLLANQDMFPFAILVASRPDLSIRSWFDVKVAARTTRITFISLDDDPTKHDDIRRFVRESIAIILHTHPFRHLLPPGWPEDHLVEYIVRKASGQFIFAAIVIAYISYLQDVPSQRLRHIVDHKSLRQGENPYSELDELYRLILGKSGNFEQLRPVLALAMNPKDVNPFLPSILNNGCRGKYPGPKHLINQHFQQLFDLSSPLEVLLAEFNSFIKFIIQEPGYFDNYNNFSYNFVFCHASLQDFLQDQDRSGYFYLDMNEWCPRLFQISSRKFIEHIPELITMAKPSSYSRWLFDMVWGMLDGVSPEVIDTELQSWATLDCSVLRYLMDKLQWPHHLSHLYSVSMTSFNQILDKHLHSMISSYSMNPLFPDELLVIFLYITHPPRGHACAMYPVLSRHIKNMLKDRLGPGFKINDCFSNTICNPFGMHWANIKRNIIDKHCASDEHGYDPFFSSEQCTAAALFMLQVVVQSMIPLGQNTIKCHSACVKLLSEKTILFRFHEYGLGLCPPFLEKCQISTRLALELRKAAKRFNWELSCITDDFKFLKRYQAYLKVYDHVYEAEGNGDPDQILAGGRSAYDVGVDTLHMDYWQWTFQ